MDFGEAQSNRGFRPAVNLQLAVDTESRAIVGVEVTNAGSDKGLAVFDPVRLTHRSLRLRPEGNQCGNRSKSVPAWMFKSI